MVRLYGLTLADILSHSLQRRFWGNLARNLVPLGKKTLPGPRSMFAFREQDAAVLTYTLEDLQNRRSIQQSVYRYRQGVGRRLLMKKPSDELRYIHVLSVLALRFDATGRKSMYGACRRWGRMIEMISALHIVMRVSPEHAQ